VRNGLRYRSERWGLLLSAAVAAIWYGLWTAGGVGLFALAMLADAERLSSVVPSVLMFIFLYWQLAPLLTATMGMSIDLRKMALYPIGVRALFAVECLLRLVMGAEMLLLLAGLSAGMLARFPRRASEFLPALLLFVLANVLLAAGVRQLIERLLQRRRFREVFVFLLVMVSALPQLLVWSGSAEGIGRRLYAVSRLLPESLLPSGGLARAYLGAAGAADWLMLAAWCAAAGVFGYWQFRRTFRFDAAAARAPLSRQETERPRLADRLYRLPARLLPDPLAALVEKELKYFWRSPRFRLLFIMGFSFGVVVWLPFAMRRETSAGGLFQESFLTLLSLYSLLLIGQATFLNSFGFDRSAARYFFWLPLPLGRLLLAKNIVAGLFVLAEIALLAVVCRLLGMPVGPWQVVEAGGVTVICLFYLLSAGNLSSILFATGTSPERVSRGAGRGVHGLLVLLYPILIAPVLAAYFARYYWGSLPGFALLLGIAAAGGMAVYLAVLPLAARLGYQRRERLLEDLCRGEGPLVSQ